MYQFASLLWKILAFKYIYIFPFDVLLIVLFLLWFLVLLWFCSVWGEEQHSIWHAVKNPYEEAC